MKNVRNREGWTKRMRKRKKEMNKNHQREFVKERKKER